MRPDQGNRNAASPDTAATLAERALALQDGPPWRITLLISDLIAHWAATAAEREQVRREAYEAGFADGVEAGAAQAEREMDQSWKQLARRIRGDADRRSFAERRAAELARAKPRPGDFTGRLSLAEYFGPDAAQAPDSGQPTSERHAA
jgi:hypothetical protein